MCELLTFMNSKIVQVALSGLENILKSGELHAMKPNPYAVLIEECGGKKLETKNNFTSPLCHNILHIFFVNRIGLDKIEFLQSHEMKDIYQKAFDIIEHFFGSEDDDSAIAPSGTESEYKFSSPQEYSQFQF